MSIDWALLFPFMAFQMHTNPVRLIRAFPREVRHSWPQAQWSVGSPGPYWPSDQKEIARQTVNFQGPTYALFLRRVLHFPSLKILRAPLHCPG